MIEANDQTTGTREPIVQKEASCGITGDPELDDFLDRVSVFGNNPVGDAFRRMMALFPSHPILVVDEDEDEND